MELRCRLKVILAEKGIKHGDFAKTIGVNAGTLSSWVTEKNFPGLKTAFEIAKLLNVSVEYIWRLEEEEGEYK